MFISTMVEYPTIWQDIVLHDTTTTIVWRDIVLRDA
jgi:hypothetical protein